MVEPSVVRDLGLGIWVTSELRVRLVPLNMLSPPVIFADHSMAVFLWVLYVIYISCWSRLCFPVST